MGLARYDLKQFRLSPSLCLQQAQAAQVLYRYRFILLAILCAVQYPAVPLCLCHRAAALHFSVKLPGNTASHLRFLPMHLWFASVAVTWSTADNLWDLPPRHLLQHLCLLIHILPHLFSSQCTRMSGQQAQHNPPMEVVLCSDTQRLLKV
ncbi:hypothetical protein BJY59DRAFT_691516 [Rhodotorula toruloides]